MLFHIKTRRPTRWPSNASILKASSLSLVVVLLLVSGIEAIVKQQQQQRSDDLSPSSQQISNNGQSSAYQNHKSSAGSPSSVSSSSPSSSSPSLSSSQVNSASPSSPSQSSQSSVGSISSVPNSISSSSQQHSNIQQPSYSSSISMSSSSSSLPSSISQQQNNVGSQMSNSGNRLDQLSSYNSGYGQMQKSSQYGNLDNMAVAASNQDQSYQAAANSVNMALANSGIFGPSSASAYGSVPQAAQSSPSQSSGISSTSSQSGSSSPQSLNPLHYFYYPAKDTNSGANSASSSSLASSVAAGSPSSKAGSGGMDMMSNAASNSYQSLAYPSYADQLNNALSSLSGSNPEAAASNQDPSYMPQPSMSSQTMDSNQMYNSNPNGLNLNNNNNNNNNQNNLGPQQHQNGPHQMFNGDLSGYSSNINSQQSSPPQQMGSQQPQSSISFNGPSNNNVGGESQFMNSHLNPSSNHQQMNSYQGSNLYNQFGDLSTSNFGNNAGSLSSVASYMSPNQPIDHQMNSQNSQHDLFSNGNNMPFSNTANQQFAASQLSPAAVAPNSNIQPPQQSHSPSSSSSSSSAASSLFNAATSLFGQSNPSSNPSSGSASQNQGGSNSLFSGQHYLNSFLPQYSQYASSGQQLGAGGNDQISSSSSASSAVAPTTSGSSHRFGIKSFIIPMLAAAGLSLLIPTMSNIGTAVGRKKRSIEDRANAGNRQQQIAFDPFNGASQLAKEISIGEYMDKIERYYAIYKNAVENDDCLNRLICEFGDAVKDVTGKSAVVTVIEKLAPAWMTGKVHLFKEATLESKEGKEKCKKYVCNSNKHQQHH